MKDIIYKLPAEFLEKIKKIYPHFYPKICQTFCRQKEQTFRVNYLKTDLPPHQNLWCGGLPFLKEQLDREGIKYKELAWPKGAFILKSDVKDLEKSNIYKNGLIYMQNVSSMIPPVTLEPKSGEKIIDLCAAPGAKTSQIASLAGKCAEVVALEKLQVRYEKLLATLKMQGADFVKAYLLDAVFAKKKFPEYFDKVLLDAPCSAEGRFYVRQPRTFSYWSQGKIRQIARLQKNLMLSALGALRQGGELVYSTCTFSPEENEEVINWVLNKFKNIQVMPLQIPIANKIQGLISWQGKSFSSSLRLTARILPNEFMEGFFIAKLSK